MQVPLKYWYLFFWTTWLQSSCQHHDSLPSNYMLIYCRENLKEGCAEQTPDKSPNNVAMFVNGKSVKGKSAPVNAVKPCWSSKSIAQFMYDNNKNCVYEGTAVRLKASSSCYHSVRSTCVFSLAVEKQGLKYSVLSCCILICMGVKFGLQHERYNIDFSLGRGK